MMAGSATRTIQKTENLTILQCIDAYGSFIRALARKLAASREEAETAAEEIFIDIWRYCERARNNQLTEEKLIAMIAPRRLIKPFQYAVQKSMANIDTPNEQGAGMDRISGFV